MSWPLWNVVLALTWSPIFFGLWYWSGALMVAAWLGQGTAYLLIRRGSIARTIASRCSSPPET